MRAVFIHDHNFVYNNETRLFYDGSGGAFDEKLWNRYLTVFEHLTVIGRKVNALPNKLVISSSENVSFSLIEGVNGIKNLVKNRTKVQKEIASIISENDFAIIRLPSTLGNWAVQICEREKKKYVLEIVGDPFEAYWHHGSLLGKIVAPIELFRLKNTVKKAGNVIYVTQSKLQERYPCKNRSVGISNVRLERVVEGSIVENFYFEDRDIFKIGLIGSFHVKYKGHIEALKALKYLKEKGYENLELQLVGTGDGAWIKKLATEYGVINQIKMVGTVKAGEEGVFPFLDFLDLYIHPSKTEGLPRVIIEAMSRGKICLGSNVGGTQELLSESYIHEPGDWRLLATQIESILINGKRERTKIALDNLLTAERYLEKVLQNNRTNFLNKIIENERD